MTARNYYDSAIRYMTTVSHVYDETVRLITDQYNVNPAIVRADIESARKGEYRYAKN